jgi:hypothetical protein
MAKRKGILYWVVFFYLFRKFWKLNGKWLGEDAYL